MFDKKKKEEEQTDGIKKKEYRITLKEKLGDTTRTIKSFNAFRFFDEENKVVLLKNDDKKIQFVEIFPEEVKSFTKPEQDKVEAKLLKLRKILEKELEEDTEEVNEKDIEEEIRVLEAIKRSFKFSKGSYITFTEDGQPEFTFLREGSEFHPFRWDADTKTIYTPSDNKKKSAILSLRNKEVKYKSKQLVEVSTIILLIIGVVLVLGNLFIGYKIWNFYDESNMAQLESHSLNTLKQCQDFMLADAKIIQAITEDLSKEYFTKNVTMIDIPDNLKSR